MATVRLPAVSLLLTAEVQEFVSRVRESARELKAVGTAASRAVRPVRDLATGFRDGVRFSRAQTVAFRQLRNEARRLVRRAKQVSRSFLSLRGIVGALAGGAGFGLLVKRAAETGVQLVYQSQLVGLTVEALQELRGASAEVGIATRATDVAIQRFARRVGSAAEGSGTLVKIFEQYGIAARDAQGNIRATEAVLADYSNAIAGAGSESERLRLAFAAFDTEGARFAEVLRNGAQGLAEARDRARELGIVSGPAARRLAELAQSFSELETTVRNVALELVSEFAPAVQGLLERVRELIPELQERLRTAVKRMVGAFDLFREAVIFVIALKLAQRIFGWVQQMKAFAIATREAKNAMLTLGRAARAVSRALVLFAVIEGLIQTVKFVVFLGRAIQDLGITWRVVWRFLQLQVLEFARTAGAHVNAFVSGTVAAISELVSGIARAFGALDLGALLRASLLGNAAAIGEEIARAVQAAVAATDISGAFDAAFASTLEALPAQLEGLRAAVGLTAEEVELAGGAISQAYREWWDSLRGLVTGFEEGAQSAGVVAEQTGLEIVAVAASLDAALGRARKELSGLAEIDFSPGFKVDAIAPIDVAGLTALQREIRAIEASLGLLPGQLVDLTGATAEQLAAYRDGLAGIQADIATIGRSWRDVWTEGGTLIGQAVGDFLAGIDSWREALRGLAADIQRVISQEIAARVSGFIFDLLGVPGRQAGGLASGLTLVGERGPELVDFRRPAQVYSTDALARAFSAAGAGGGVTVVFAPQVGSGGGADVDGALQRAFAEFRRDAPRVVAAALRTRGPAQSAVQDLIRTRIPGR